MIIFIYQSAIRNMTEIEKWNEEVYDWLHSSKVKTIILLSRSAGTLGLLGSIYIIQDVLKDSRRRKPTKNRIILLMSICDFLSSISGPILGPVMGPKEVGAPGSIGNTTTCTIQGFMILSTVTSSAYYNVTLALCYLLMVRFEFSDDRLRKLEPYFLFVPICMGLLVAFPAFFVDVYNFNGDRCFVARRPCGCLFEVSPVKCGNGDLVDLWYLISSIEIAIAACFIIGCMIMMYKATLQRERNGDRFRFSTIFVLGENRDLARSSPRTFRMRRTLSDTMKAQGMWYSGAYLISFSPILLSTFIHAYWVALLMVTADMLGFTNAVIYIRPRFLKFRRDYPSIGIVSSIWQTLVRSTPTISSRESLRRSSQSNSISLLWGNPGWTSYKHRIASGMRCLKRLLFTGSSNENITGENCVHDVVVFDVEQESSVSSSNNNTEKGNNNIGIVDVMESKGNVRTQSL